MPNDGAGSGGLLAAPNGRGGDEVPPANDMGGVEGEPVFADELPRGAALKKRPDSRAANGSRSVLFLFVGLKGLGGTTGGALGKKPEKGSAPNGRGGAKGRGACDGEPNGLPMGAGGCEAVADDKLDGGTVGDPPNGEAKLGDGGNAAVGADGAARAGPDGIEDWLPKCAGGPKGDEDSDDKSSGGNALRISARGSARGDAGKGIEGEGRDEAKPEVKPDAKPDAEALEGRLEAKSDDESE